MDRVKQAGHYEKPPIIFHIFIAYTYNFSMENDNYMHHIRLMLVSLQTYNMGVLPNVITEL